MKRNYSFIIIFLLIPVRIMFDTNEKILYIVASINLVALYIVINSILIRIKKNFFSTIEAYPQQIANREKQKVNKRINLLCYGSLMTIYIIYMCFFCSGMMNDVISILSLGLSLSDDEVVNLVDNFYRRNI